MLNLDFLKSMRQLDQTTQHKLEDIAMDFFGEEDDDTFDLLFDGDALEGDAVLSNLNTYRDPNPAPDNTNRDSDPVPDSKNPCEAVDDLLRKDMMQMTSSDRATLAEELHGVTNLGIVENDDEVTNERVTNALFELNQILEHQIPDHEKTAFLKAQSLEQTAGTYVNDIEFRMKFLRCKLFNANEAAQLLINYLELVLELYGDICLTRPICLEDVQTTKEERAAFRAGYIQLLPFGDRAGRRILMITTDALLYSTYIRVRMIYTVLGVMKSSHDNHILRSEQKANLFHCQRTVHSS